ncbi:MAG: hypothetical protein JXA00_00250 [Candidatus Thermoplasmatota archaeon]|nr:hypothetical protein [Candidatus Thermoplasmatota archaeon]
MLTLVTSFFAAGDTISLNAYDKDSIHAAASDSSYLIRLTALHIESVAADLAACGYDVQWLTLTDDSVDLIVNDHEYRVLEGQGYTFSIVEKSRPFREIQAELSEGLDDVPPGYLDLAEIYDEMNTTATTYPLLCQMVDLTATYGTEPTYENRHLYALKISDNVCADEDEPTFLMVSCHHCREIVTPVIALYAIEQFTTQYGSNPQVTALVDAYEIWVCPVWNPDGYEYVFNVNNMWRKNRHYFSQYSSYGVDLNRNYPFGWDGPGGGSTDPFSDTYKGPSIASEAETQTMIAFSDDQHFAKVMDYHSYGREVLYGYIPSYHSHPFYSFFQSEAVSISYQAGYGGSIRVPSAEGENFQWQIFRNGSYANLMETHTSFQPTYASALAEAAQIWPSTVWLLERPISVSGNVYDASTGAALTASVTIEGVSFVNGECFITEPSFGRFHLFLPPATYTLTFEVPGYVPQSHQVTVTLESAEILDVPVHVPNETPLAPTITGPTSGNAGTTYKYTFVTTDPDGDDVYYYIDWGDGTYEDWIGPYLSGHQVFVNHKWDEKGSYTIQAKAKDTHNAESGWGTLDIEMPLSSEHSLRLQTRIHQQSPSIEQLFFSRVLRMFM